MRARLGIIAVYAVVVAAYAFGCVTSPLGRRQLIFLPDSQMNLLGEQAFQELKTKTPISRDPAVEAYVKCVVGPIIDVVGDRAGVKSWETVVFKDDSANAFALPGGKIGVHTGLLRVAKTPGQLAAVLGHEVGHVIAKHGAERVSEQMAASGAIGLIDAFTRGDEKSSGQRNLLLAALGVGVQVGIMLPHSRTQESEADVIGEDLMSKAGFDPKESMALWHNMMADSKGAPPEWLSTHPAGENRVANLQAHLKDFEPQYEQAKAAGKLPQCRVPGG